MPILVVFVISLSITLFSYLRTVLLDATNEGARYAALADQSPATGAARTQKLIGGSLGPALLVEVSGSEFRLGELRAVRLRSEARFGFASEFNLSLISVEAVATGEPIVTR